MAVDQSADPHSTPRRSEAAIEAGDVPHQVEARPPTRLRRAWDSDLAYSFRRSPVAMVSAGVALTLVVLSVLAPWIMPQDPFNPAALSLWDGELPPFTTSEHTGDYYLLGSDTQGRDILSAIFYGGRISLLVGFAAVLFALVLGTTLGLIAGYVGGWADSVIMRIADVQLSFPSILIAMLIFGLAKALLSEGQGLSESTVIYVLVIAIGLSEWVQFARTVRGSTMVEKNKEYVQAARLIGLHPILVMIRHVLPNVTGPILVIGTISLAIAIITEATLSFLGVGMPATQPSLGTLIRIGQDFLFSGQWWMILFPALALVALALSVNLLGDWLRDALNPKLR
jgi:peptide/nickel transport system permease protein